MNLVSPDANDLTSESSSTPRIVNDNEAENDFNSMLQWTSNVSLKSKIAGLGQITAGSDYSRGVEY